MSAPVVLAQLSDPHLGATWSTADPVAGLARALGAVRELRPAAAAVLVSGDLADHAADSEYELLRELLEPLTIPVHLMVGNHDDRSALRRHFELPGTGDEHVQYAVEVGALALVVLDSLRPGADGGELGEARLVWLDETLAAAPDAPTIVAVHHHPAPIGMPAFDRIGLPDSDRRSLGDIVGRHQQVLAVIAGHVHRAAVGLIAGRPAFTAPSTYDEAVLDLVSDQLAFGSGPPGFAIHVFDGDRLVTHVQSTGARLGDAEG